MPAPIMTASNGVRACTAAKAAQLLDEICIFLSGDVGPLRAWTDALDTVTANAGDRLGRASRRISDRQDLVCGCEKCEEQGNANLFLQVLHCLDLDLCTQFDDAIGRYAEKVRRFCRVL